MPLIRYKIGDRGIMQEPLNVHGSNFPKLKMITGRTNDRVITPDNRFIDSYYFIHTIGVEYNKEGHIKQFQIVQHTKEAITLNIIPQGDPRLIKINDINCARNQRLVQNAD